jgi:hypothetical protein
MTISFQESYRFTYEFDGSEYAFHVLADSEDLAKRKAESMAHASFFGKLEDGTTNTPPTVIFLFRSYS